MKGGIWFSSMCLLSIMMLISVKNNYGFVFNVEFTT